jgi:hypothetical protein
MSFAIYDVNGFVGDLATNTGMAELARFIEAQEEMPDAKEFIKKGAALITDFLVGDFQDMEPKKETVQQTITNFLELVEKADTVVIISDGLNDDLEDLDEGGGQ